MRDQICRRCRFGVNMCNCTTESDWVDLEDDIVGGMDKPKGINWSIPRPICVVLGFVAGVILTLLSWLLVGPPTN